MEFAIDIITDRPDPADRDRILALLDADNLAKSGWVDGPDLAVLIRDAADGTVLGGLWAVDDFGWIFIQYMLVPETLRGQGMGARLIEAAETVARQRGAVGLWVNTFDFQARGFYEKQGFALFGSLEAIGPAAGQYFLRKIF